MLVRDGGGGGVLASEDVYPLETLYAFHISCAQTVGEILREKHGLELMSRVMDGVW